MRTRLSVLLLVLMGVVLVSLGVPLAASIAGSEARALQADRLADLALFVSLVPTQPVQPAGSAQPVDEVAVQRDLRRYDELYAIAVTVYDAAGRARVSSRAMPSMPSTSQQTSQQTSQASTVVQTSLRTALAGRQTEEPARLLPWNHRPLVAAQPVVRDGDVVGAVVSVSPVDGARVRVLKRWLLLGAAELVALAGAAVLAGRLAGWLLRPVARLDDAAHQISAGDLGARVPTGSGPPELRRLEHSFNDMAAHVQEAVEAQQAFIADASHQLRNPLAALLIRLEGLRFASSIRRPGGGTSPDGKNGTDSLLAATDSALADGRHLAGTLDRMLALATVEHTGASAGPVDVAAVLDERLGSWRVVAERRKIQVQRTGVSHATGQHEAGALAGALDAVLDNALKYSPEQSTVTVHVLKQDSWIAIMVTDDGPGVPAEELPRLADRFWRSDRWPAATGTGLGMSIAKALIERHGGRLDVGRDVGRGLRVSLQVRVATDAGQGLAQGLARR
jgi:signal transduction histidine kinase